MHLLACGTCTIQLSAACGAPAAQRCAQMRTQADAQMFQGITNCHLWLSLPSTNQHATCHRAPHHKRASATNHCHVAEAAPSHKVATATQRAAARMTVASLHAIQVGGREESLATSNTAPQHHSTLTHTSQPTAHSHTDEVQPAASNSNPARKVMLTALWALGFRWGGGLRR